MADTAAATAVRYRNALYCRHEPHNRQQRNQIEILEGIIAAHERERIAAEDATITSFIENNSQSK